VPRKFTTDFVIIRYRKFHKLALYHSHFPGSLMAGSAVDVLFEAMSVIKYLPRTWRHMFLIEIYIYRVSQEECARLLESVP